MSGEIHLDQLVGKPEAEAFLILELLHTRYRVIQRDDESLLGDCEYDPDRVDLVVKDGKISGAYGG